MGDDAITRRVGCAGASLEAGPVKVEAIVVDATTLAANAARCSIVRRDDGASYEDFSAGLAGNGHRDPDTSRASVRATT